MRRTEGAGKFLRHVPAEYPKTLSDNLKQPLAVFSPLQCTNSLYQTLLPIPLPTCVFANFPSNRNPAEANPLVKREGKIPLNSFTLLQV